VAQHYDAILIGSGQAANPLAESLTEAGWRVALVEREHVGGTCINVGCTPTKTMVACARVAYLARRAADYGVRTGPVSVDMVAVRQRKRDMVTRFRQSDERRLEANERVDLLRGEARFKGPGEVEVRLAAGEMRRLTAGRIFINTGDRPSRPPVPGLDEVPALDSTTVMELDAIPEHLLVLGGGYVGLEFGQMFRRFGSRVTIVQRDGQLLAHEDADVAAAVADILRQDGIEVLLDTEATAAARGINDEVRLTVRRRGAGDGVAAERTLVGSHLLLAAGRTPNTDALDLGAAGVETDDQGFVVVDERLQTSVPGIYALGDVKGGPAFTHISYDDYRLVESNLLHGGQATTRGRLVPYTVFIDPQLGRVGPTEAEARRQGRRIRVARMTMNRVARAVEVGESRGFLKVVVDAESEQILGAAVLGIEGGELIAMLEIAMMGRLPFTALRDAIFDHPNLAEGLNNLFFAFEE
jgi:pyruvate/2-oxoglutarate dehydrogenase complex dihydrolipoamide dehydrogenase (E3) component